ncbi:isomerase-domain-containing protein [Lipomyces tetrasporus]|uniref:N-(5'-phosphoribosyl)anthranilate isomerase n=1 Tax=Lipomyces tetrasporus TaxID=54092 RepID=A0AAD7QSG2_9ASCO|nr:isomerase-domain-containing protein [Lipomyces tetrasporus]KAJ8100677.1 isomerase-domain-containing protein [Lipomyces tetrasporus]
MTVSATSRSTPIVKICGTRTVEAAQCAISSGADLIGMILVPNLKRTVSADQAKAISRAVHEFRDSRPLHDFPLTDDRNVWFAGHIEQIRRRAPLVVGVFRNQSLEEILRLQREYELDIVQLHGSEPLSWTHEIPVPVIKKFAVEEDDLMRPGLHAVPLLDGGAGGEGHMISWEGLPESGAFILAGGLTADNVALAVRVPNLHGVDVSSGVETDGEQDLDKIKLFIKNAKGL